MKKILLLALILTASISGAQTFVTTYGLKRNMYSGTVNSEVVLDDLFAE